MKLTAKRLRILTVLARHESANAAMIAIECGEQAKWAHEALRSLFYHGLMTTVGAGPNGSTMCRITPAGRSLLESLSKEG